MQLAAIEAGVQGALRWRRKLRSRHSGHFFHFVRHFGLQSLGSLQDIFCIRMPRGFTRRGQVIDARQRLRLLQTHSRDVGQQSGARGCAELVVDDGHLVALLGQAQHGLGKVATFSAIHPTGSKNDVLGALLGNALLARQFAVTVNIEGTQVLFF